MHESANVRARGASDRQGSSIHVVAASKSSVRATTPRAPLGEKLAPRLWAVRHESRARFLEVRLAHLPYVVLLGFFHDLGRIQAIYLRGIQPKHLGAHFRGDFRIAILILELL